MNNEKKETTTFGKILKGAVILALTIGAGIAIYDHRKQIGNACKKVKVKLFNQNKTISSSESTKSVANNYNPRRNYNIRKN
jgi:hypothetical protein